VIGDATSRRICVKNKLTTIGSHDKSLKVEEDEWREREREREERNFKREKRENEV